MYLGLDLPPPPLFKDVMEKNIIPQVPIFNILKKYDGISVDHNIRAGRRKFRITRLPHYLVLHMKRFTKNNFFVEKNPTIVNFPVKNMELKDIMTEGAGMITPGLACEALGKHCIRSDPCHHPDPGSRFFLGFFGAVSLKVLWLSTATNTITVQYLRVAFWKGKYWTELNWITIMAKGPIRKLGMRTIVGSLLLGRYSSSRLGSSIALQAQVSVKSGVSLPSQITQYGTAVLTSDAASEGLLVLSLLKKENEKTRRLMLHMLLDPQYETSV
jgi:Ubiquitin carboxyl-terminal hydrolase